MPEIPTLTPKNIEDEVASQVISAWRDQLTDIGKWGGFSGSR